MDLIFLIAAVVGVGVFSFAFGLLFWFVIFGSSPLEFLQRTRAVMIGFAIFVILLVTIVDVGRFALASDAVRSNPDAREWLFIAPCLVAAIFSPNIAALQMKIRRVTRAA